MLKVGGIYVSPFEVEAALSTHDAVLECAVVGHADEHQLVKPRAFVVLRTARAARRRSPPSCRRMSRNGRAVQVPALDRVRHRPAETATGKIQRFKAAPDLTGCPSLPPPARAARTIAGCPAGAGRRPTLVFLHEGLGSDRAVEGLPRPRRRRHRLRHAGLSAYGYGHSDLLQEKRGVGYMHPEAARGAAAVAGGTAALRRRSWSAQRRRLDRIDPCRRAGAGRSRVHADGAACVRRGRDRSLDRRRPRWPTRPPTLPKKLGRYHADRRPDVLGLERHLAGAAIRAWNHRGRPAGVTARVLLIQGADERIRHEPPSSTRSCAG